MILDSHNCLWLMRYPHETLAGGSMYAVLMPAVIPPAGACRGSAASGRPAHFSRRPGWLRYAYDVPRRDSPSRDDPGRDREDAGELREGKRQPGSLRRCERISWACHARSICVPSPAAAAQAKPQKLDEEYTKFIKEYLAGSAHPLRRV